LPLNSVTAQENTDGLTDIDPQGYAMA